MQSEKLERIGRLVLDRLESLQRAGARQLPRVKSRDVAVNEASRASETAGADKSLAAEAASPTTERMSVSAGWQSPAAGSLFDASDALSRSENAPTLDVLQQKVALCTRCGELARTRKQTVFGVGNPQARLCFLGEAPGADEDRLGEPFVGRAGQLLTKIIEACRMKREDVYIMNMIKCRPPQNRNPLPEELTNCRGYLERQFDLIQPEFICCLGAVSAQNLLGTTLSIGKLRGKVHAYRGATVVCTYHPAFLLRSPAFKKEAWEDMKLLLREMGVEL